ncbi:malate dehydrogenase (quinone) [Mycetocola reblochoni]|uniref:Probable malate:quinone oxidoreductase n=2 Tax=Mycetocola reblochoni TaxID=331618 RepID=A0A1R4JL87_9MICO|nr:malate dehydrogenase (quinone) [Mycetocola reblochoni]RLP70562.1 malate dehydrogenase (quinone) [Mycetocola reblochoni]SJN32810.1 Malate:quinone oxidoreductase [Mycetocola reblochoni REB411]
MSSEKTVDVVLIGGGIMSATLASLITRLQPDWSVQVFERLGDVAQESSNPWNNAGTGHAALCELNYMSESADGTLDPAKAIGINEQFQVSRQFWASLVRDGSLGDPGSFINSTPHMTFVTGEKDVAYLRRRYEVLREQPLFAGIEYSEDSRVINQWAPLLMRRRRAGEPFAATRIPAGTDVDFGSLTHQLFDAVTTAGAVLNTDHEVRSLRKQPDGTWTVGYRNLLGRVPGRVNARFVFVGAGGWALKLLQKARIPEIKGYGVFPISGEFLRTDNPEIVAAHEAKVYSQAKVGAPPMSVPHLDARMVDGQRSLLFGPYAGFSPRFLKKGRLLDIVAQVRPGNLVPMLAVAKDNPGLIRYLLSQLTASRATKFAELQEFMPTARPEDWYRIVAGQRAQVMKKDPERGGVLQFGTEVISSADGTIAGLLGASPGASTAVPIMLDVLRRCFPDRIDGWEDGIRGLIPSYGSTLNNRPRAADETMRATAEVLGISL